ncbi:hypothetical protein [Methylocystis rosea]|nr:hypothetical protein [Methylocystis rosea]
MTEPDDVRSFSTPASLAIIGAAAVASAALGVALYFLVLMLDAALGGG